MSTEVRWRRGTTAQHATFTGAAGEVTIDTDKSVVVVHDGATAGGNPLLSEFKAINKVDTVSVLIAKSAPTNKYTVNVLNYHSGLKGGGGVFYWDATGNATEHNGGTVISPLATFPTDWSNQTQLSSWFNGSTLIGTGVWRRQYDGAVNVKWFGAKGDGVTDDTKAIQQAVFTSAGVSSLALSAGTYLVSDNITFANKVCFDDGAILKVAGTNKKVTFNKDINAPISKVFDLAATALVFIPNTESYLEWFGGVTGNAAFDNSPIFELAQYCCKKIKLLPRDYWISNTVDLSVNGFEIEGSGIGWTATTLATRVINTSATLDTFHLKPTTYINTDPTTFLAYVRLKDFDILRTALTPPTAGSEASGGAGIRFNYTLFCEAINVRVCEHTIGFYAGGTIRTYLTRCIAFRSNAATPTTTTNDCFYGIFLDGNVNIGFGNSGNESTYITDCTAVLGGSPNLSSSTGLLSNFSFNDLFVNNFETSYIGIGVLLDGVTPSGYNAYCDAHLRHCIIDTFLNYGIVVRNAPTGGAIDIANCYAAPSTAASATACYQFNNIQAAVSLTNSQAICTSNNSTIGISANSCSNIKSVSNNIVESARPIGLSSCTSCSIEDIITNTSKKPIQASVWLQTTNRCYIKPIITGASAKHLEGVQIIDTASMYNEINTTGINSSAIASGKTCLISDTYPSQTTGQIIHNNLISGYNV
jgi:hypothetical protein